MKLFKKKKERLAYPSRRGYKRLKLNYLILDMLMYSFLLASIHFIYLSRIEDNWLYFVYNEKLLHTFFSVVIVSLSSAYLTKMIVGSQNKILSIKKVFIMAVLSFLTALILYADIIMIVFNEYSFIIALLSILAIKIITIVFSYAIGGALL